MFLKAHDCSVIVAQYKVVKYKFQCSYTGRTRNLRTTTKFTTTTSVDRERTGTRTSVSAGKRKLKMQSIGRSTTTTLNVNKQVENSRTVMFVRNKVFSQRRRLKRCKILFYKPYVYFHCFGKRDIPMQ